jgi:YVTN family beta-propeller protein
VTAWAAILLGAPAWASAQPFLLVSTPADDSVVAIDLSNHTVAATVSLSGLPTGGAMSRSGRQLYASLSESNALAVCDIASGTVRTVPVGPGPFGVAVAARRVYVANAGGNTVSVVEPDAGTVVATLTVGDGPIALAAAGRRLYVANRGSGTVSVVDTSNHSTLATIPVGTFPSGLALHGRSGRLYVANFLDDTVSVIDTTTQSVLSTIPVVKRPRGLAVNATGQRLYVAGFEEGRIQVIDTSTGTPALEAPSGGHNPLDITLGPQGMRVYVAHLQETQGLTVLDAQTLAVIDAVDVPAGPMSFVGVAPRRPRARAGSGWLQAAQALFRQTRVVAGSALDRRRERRPDSEQALAEEVVILDTEFNPADWEATGGGEHHSNQEATGGNPGAWRRMQHFGPANVAHRLTRPGSAYDPSQGAILSIDVSWDRRLLAESVALEGFLVEQGGTIYRTTERALFLPAWQSDSRTGLVAEDFDNGSGGRPDFTANGGPLRFGYFRRTTTGQTLTHGIDNFQVTIHPQGTTLEGTLRFQQSLVVVHEDDALFITVLRIGGRLGAVSAEVRTERPDGSVQLDSVSWADGDDAPRSILIIGLDLPPDSGARTARLTLQNATGGAAIHPSEGRMSIAVIPLNWGPALEALYLRMLPLLAALSPYWLLALAIPAALAARRRRRA